MIDPKLISRINELANKKKTVGLTKAEEKEQEKLRKKYLTSFRERMRDQLERIEFVDEDTEDTKPKH
ncbi:DUF896 domain-containing protein [Longirhabdus pacifica]|uniref:DUF896 domain-containing protein n=1 Tax=Longirhabdus pacifica TaxID=2305227 RepID=UPI0013E8CD4A|nr:DUF896 domain-containing protein [Longirhabdus pacifica]